MKTGTYVKGRTALAMHILRVRLSRFGMESTCAALMPGELCSLMRCSRRYAQEMMRSLARQRRLVRIAHGFYRAASPFPVSVQAEAFPAGSAEAAASPGLSACSDPSAGRDA